MLKELHQIPSKIIYVDSDNFGEVELPEKIGTI
jgi:hypothetical protein